MKTRCVKSSRLVLLLVLLVALLLGSAGSMRHGTAHADDPHAFFTQFHPETGHNQYLPFLYAWREWGGLMVFGHPISEAFTEHHPDLGRTFATQYFERNRLELHPEHGWPYRVLLGRLGVEVLQLQGRDWTTFPKADPSAPHYFAETGHAVADVFWGTWSGHGLEFGDPGVSFRESLALFGMPISPTQLETTSAGDTRLTQWFERARLEYHPHSPEPHKVLLGLLGRELAGERGAEPPFQPAQPLDAPHAATRRVVLAEAHQANRVITYRSDIQDLVDQATVEWTRVFNAGGDSRVVLQQLRETLKAHLPYAAPVYATRNYALRPWCHSTDARDPVSHMVSGRDLGNPGAMTIGVTPLYEGRCGTSVSFMVVVSYP